jgi:hypothetical protein
MRYLLLLLLAAPAFANPNNMTYTNGVGLRTVLTYERRGSCWDRHMMFEVDWQHRAVYGCWSESQGLVYIDMQDGEKRVMPKALFMQTPATGAQLKMGGDR